MRIAGGIAALLVLVGTGTTWWATTDLAHGLRELPTHWWSGLAMAPLLIGLAVLAALAVTTRSRAASEV